MNDYINFNGDIPEGDGSIQPFANAIELPAKKTPGWVAVIYMVIISACGIGSGIWLWLEG